MLLRPRTLENLKTQGATLTGIRYISCPKHHSGTKSRGADFGKPTFRLRLPHKTAQEGPRGPKTNQEGSKLAPSQPKRAPRRPKMAPRRPKMAPRGSFICNRCICVFPHLPRKLPQKCDQLLSLSLSLSLTALCLSFCLSVSCIVCHNCTMLGTWALRMSDQVLRVCTPRQCSSHGRPHATK